MPLWVQILYAAGGDPLRAQQIEAELSEEWWDHFIEYTHAAADAQRRRTGRGSRTPPEPIRAQAD